MAQKSNIFLITIELLLVAYILLDIYASIFVDSNNIVAPADESFFSSNSSNEDPKIVGLGNFAVDEYNKFTKSNLKFESVVKSMFVQSQSNYMLLIQVSDGSSFSKSKQYGAVVNVQGDQISLIAFDEFSEEDM